MNQLTKTEQEAWEFVREIIDALGGGISGERMTFFQLTVQVGHVPTVSVSYQSAGPVGYLKKKFQLTAAQTNPSSIPDETELADELLLKFGFELEKEVDGNLGDQAVEYILRRPETENDTIVIAKNHCGWYFGSDAAEWTGVPNPRTVAGLRRLAGALEFPLKEPQ